MVCLCCSGFFEWPWSSDCVEWPLQLYGVAVLFVLQCMADLAVLQWLFWPLFVFFYFLFFF